MIDSLCAIVLDFDGVVVESNDIKTQAFDRVFSRFPAYKEKLMQFHFCNISLARGEKFNYLLELIAEENNEKLKREISIEFSEYTTDLILSAPLVKGIENFFNHFSGEVPLYLASVTPEEDLKLILKHRNLNHCFDGVYGCPPWIKSNAIRDVLLQKSINADQCLLIGDSEGDRAAASEVGVRFIARNSGLSFNEAPALIFSDMDEITEYLIDAK